MFWWRRWMGHWCLPLACAWHQSYNYHQVNHAAYPTRASIIQFSICWHASGNPRLASRAPMFGPVHGLSVSSGKAIRAVRSVGSMVRRTKLQAIGVTNTIPRTPMRRTHEPTSSFQWQPGQDGKAIERVMGLPDLRSEMGKRFPDNRNRSRAATGNVFRPHTSLSRTWGSASASRGRIRSPRESGVDGSICFKWSTAITALLRSEAFLLGNKILLHENNIKLIWCIN